MNDVKLHQPAELGPDGNGMVVEMRLEWNGCKRQVS
jgi:hypothetical protein